MNDALSILLVGDYPPDPTLGSPKVFYKLQQEFTALGHSCDLLLSPDIRASGNRQVRQLVSPWHAGIAIARKLHTGRYHVVDAASAEGLFFGVRKKFGTHKNVAYVCRSNGLEALNYRRMLDDAAAGLTRKPWTRRVWYPVSRLSQVAAAARMADRLLLLNDGDREYAFAHGWQPPDRIDVIPHGMSERFLADAPDPDLPRGEGLLFCGSWDQVKGVHYLVEAFTRLNAEAAHYPLTVLGPGFPEDHVRRAFPEHLRSLVRVIDRGPEEDVIRAFRAHDVLLWPSTYEGFGLVLIEAMSQQLAVVATPVGCGRAVIRDGVNGVLVPTRDPDALAAAARRLLADLDFRRRLGSAARAAVSGLSWRTCAARTIECYQAALRRAG